MRANVYNNTTIGKFCKIHVLTDCKPVHANNRKCDWIRRVELNSLPNRSVFETNIKDVGSIIEGAAEIVQVKTILVYILSETDGFK